MITARSVVREKTDWLRYAVLMLVASGVVLFANCDPFDDARGGDVCNSAGYAIANRTVDCTNDTKLANARYSDFHYGFQCLYDSSMSENEKNKWFSCSDVISDLDCKLVQENGDNLSWWISDPKCEGRYLQIETSDAGVDDADGVVDAATDSDSGAEAGN